MAITSTNSFKGRHYTGEVILLAVRRYLRYPLIYKHVAEMLAERDHRWQYEVLAKQANKIVAAIRAGTETLPQQVALLHDIVVDHAGEADQDFLRFDELSAYAFPETALRKSGPDGQL